MDKFKNIEYLQQGNPKQQLVFALLNEFKIIEILKNYNPLVIGTIPIEIDLPESDVDIILETDNFNELEKFLTIEFHHFQNFTIQQRIDEDKTILVCNFIIDKVPFEIYAENKPTYLQNGFLHMIKEYEILRKFGNDFKNQIIQLKKEGFKTEPAFAKLLNLHGNPYIELLHCKV
ncbi:DUF4269 domain-containing protein [Moheibacter sediminis]|uniref:DUF4269 domain-containing protein n=1 Tax=Moheibacter sediminis TaxID=1434700 RepID=A0A1W1Z2E1_9FLAO|nr:DUF4269 domain-containing protein [Moheibacter sediminis]SMC42599.1 protein of unknown function [Moheibacter sediminis]